MSRPLIGLLVATVAFFALWTVALKGSHSGSTAGATGRYQSAINAAHNAVKVANGAAAAEGGQVAPSTAAPAATPAATPPAITAPPPRTKSTARTPARKSAAATTASKPAATVSHPTASKAAAPASPPTAAARLGIVDGALRDHRVIALLFYNPAAADDRAVKHELASITTHRGRVVKLSVPISELADYTVVTNQVSVSTSPTLVLVDGAAQATTIVGFADSFEIAHRIDDALAVGRR